MEDPVKRNLIMMAVVAGVGTATFVAAPASAEAPECNWGELTAWAVAQGFDQGDHSSDPSGDGHGPDTADEPRVGLANVSYALFGGDRGDLEATCAFIDSLFNP
jgi:hypothetical protein